MKMVYKQGMILISVVLLSSSIVLFAQASVQIQPTFALSIEQKPLEAENSPGTILLLVKYANITEVVQQDNCVVTPWAYEMIVLRDGIPVEKKKVLGKKTEESQYPGRIKVESDFNYPKPCGRIISGIKPGESIKFILWVSSDYDMTAPGTYDITVTRKTDRWNSEKSVTVKSNTLTIVVPDPEANTLK